MFRLLDSRIAFSQGDKEHAACEVVTPQIVLALLELLVLVLTRHTAALLQPAPLARCVVHDPVKPDELELLPTAFEDLAGAAAVLANHDPSIQVKTAALACSVILLTGWWNARAFARAAGSSCAEKFTPGFSDTLESACWEQLGNILIEANSVPIGSVPLFNCPEPGDHKHVSAFSHLFSKLQQSAASASSMSDSDRVQIAVLVCNLIITCRHELVASSSLPALVLSQALSPREDLQNVAWNLLARLRKEAQCEC